MLGRSKLHNRRLTAALGAFVAAGLLACGSDNNKNTPTSPTTTEQQTTQIINSIKSDSNIFAVMHWSDIGEINAGKVASTAGTDTGVVGFATQMVIDHTALDSAAFALSQSAGIAAALSDSTLPNAISAEQDTLQKLASVPKSDSTAAGGDSTTVLPPSAFDQSYIATQVKDHTRTLAIVDAAIKIAQNPALRDMLQTTVRPMIAMHLQAAQKLQTRVGSPTS